MGVQRLDEYMRMTTVHEHRLQRAHDYTARSHPLHDETCPLAPLAAPMESAHGDAKSSQHPSQHLPLRRVGRMYNENDDTAGNGTRRQPTASMALPRTSGGAVRVSRPAAPLVSLCGQGHRTWAARSVVKRANVVGGRLRLALRGGNHIRHMSHSTRAILPHHRVLAPKRNRSTTTQTNAQPQPAAGLSVRQPQPQSPPETLAVAGRAMGGAGCTVSQ